MFSFKFTRIATSIAMMVFCLSRINQTYAESPNIITILCDDLGYGDLACYGHPKIKTPHLDQLAKQGVRLTDCYSSSPVCSASRAGFLTGRTPTRTGVYDWIPENHPMHLPKDEITIAHILKENGYETAHMGKWHCNGFFNSPKHPQPGDHGFQHWFSTQNNAMPTHENPVNFVRNGQAVGKIEGFACQIVADESIKWLKQTRDKSKPFFLHVCFHEPHEKVASPPQLVKEYLPVSRYEDEAQYFANVANMDAAVGRLMKTLDGLGLAEKTRVIFTSDNGPETLNRYGNRRSYGSSGVLRGMKLHIYEGGIRVPGIIRWSGQIKPSQVIGEPVCSVDILPTICDLLKVELPNKKPLDGTSLLPLFKGEKLKRTTPLFWHYYRAISRPRVAIREGDWKMVAHWSGPEGTIPLGWNVSEVSQKIMKTAKLTRFELYNLKKDISEKFDVSKQEPERVKAMRQKIIKKYSAVQKEGPFWDTKEFDEFRRQRVIKQRKK